jgi:phosphatidate cytidylyltransferase
MLKQRVLTAIPLALVVIWVILFQPTQALMWLLYVVALIAGWEWSRLGGLDFVIARGVYALLACLSPWLLLRYADDFIPVYVSAAALCWLLVTAWLFRARPCAASQALSPLKLLFGMLVIPAAVLAMHAIHSSRLQGPDWLLFGLMLVWVADIGAYFSGKNFGRHKLAPHISPGKTREGLYGAAAAVALYSLAGAWYFDFSLELSVLMLLLMLVLSLISVAGDLFESLMKREFGVKDSGAILPGHGGVLDRIDSVLAAMPLFMLGRQWLLQQGFGL